MREGEETGKKRLFMGGPHITKEPWKEQSRDENSVEAAGLRNSDSRLERRWPKTAMFPVDVYKT